MQIKSGSNLFLPRTGEAQRSQATRRSRSGGGPAYPRQPIGRSPTHPVNVATSCLEHLPRSGEEKAGAKA
jgi:hypothetical protein